MKKIRPILICAGLAILYALPIFTLPGFGAFDPYLKIETIAGESDGEQQSDGTGGTVLKHKNEIDVLAWSWGVSESGSAGGGGGAGKAQCLEEITVTKFIDKSSPKLMLHCFDGKVLPEVTLTVTEPDGGGAATSRDYFQITMVDVIITAVAGAGDEDAPNRPVESFSFNFTKIKVKYTENDAAKTTTEFNWDLENNSEY